MQKKDFLHCKIRTSRGQLNAGSWISSDSWSLEISASPAWTQSQWSECAPARFFTCSGLHWRGSCKSKKGKRDWQDESDPQNWHEALQLPKLPWQQKQSSLTMFTGLSYSQLMPTPWQATEQYRNTRDPYKSTHNSQFTISFYCLFSTSLAPNPGARTALICSFPAVTTSQPCHFGSRSCQRRFWWKGPPTDTALHFCLQILQPFLEKKYVTMSSLRTKRYEKR